LLPIGSTSLPSHVGAPCVSVTVWPAVNATLVSFVRLLTAKTFPPTWQYTAHMCFVRLRASFRFFSVSRWSSNVRLPVVKSNRAHAIPARRRSESWSTVCDSGPPIVAMTLHLS